MLLRTRIVALASASALLLAGCGGGHAALPHTVPHAPLAPYTGPQQLADFTWGARLVQGAQYLGPANAGSISLEVELKPQNLPGLLQYAQMASDPSSPLYRRFLTPQDIGDRYGASLADYRAAAAYFEKYHLGVGTWPQRLAMVVSGKQSDVEAAFGTTFGLYREFGQTFVAPATQPHFSTAVPVAGVLGLVHLNLNRTYLIRPGNGNYFGMSAPQLRRAFDFTGAARSGFNGAGITVGIIGTGPISSLDVPTLARLDNVSAAAVNLVPVVAQTPSPQNNNTGTAAYGSDPTGFATPPPVTAPCNQLGPDVVSANCNPEDGEAQLDTEQVALLAPGATVNFYLAYNTKDCTAYGAPSGCEGIEGLGESDAEIQQAIADNTADAVSLSYGLPEPDGVGYYYDNTGSGIGPEEMAALKAEGIAVFVSSGDNGAYACTDANGAPVAPPCVSYPASDPSVVAVGGVNYPMDGFGNLPPSAQITAWASNTTLGGDGLADNSPGSGGGLSAYFTASQAGQTGLPATIQGVATGGKRSVPDVAMLGDPLTGPQLLMNAAFKGQTGLGAAGGTSAAAPEMAAAWAVVLQACKAAPACATATGAHPWRLGDPKGLFYGLYAKPAYATTFYDVVAGSNDDYSNPCAGGPCSTPTPAPQYLAGYGAGKGYDMVTGLGVPFVGHLINAVVSGQNVP